MKDHLSETELQQYALEGENSPEGIRGHIKACEQCAVKATNYRMIFKEVSRAPLPAVDADMAAQVLAKLGELSVRPERPVLSKEPVHPARQKRDRSPIYWPVAAALIIFVPCWL